MVCWPTVLTQVQNWYRFRISIWEWTLLSVFIKIGQKMTKWWVSKNRFSEPLYKIKFKIQPVLKKTHFSWKKSIYAGCNFIYVWKLILTFGMASLGSNDSLHSPGHALIPRQEDSGVICLHTFLQTFSMSSLFVGCSFISSLMPSPLINFYFVGNLWKENFTIFHMSSIRNL